MKLQRKFFMVIGLVFLMTQMSFAQNERVLFVMSEADTLLLKEGKKKRQTGVFLNEFYLAYKAVANKGYTVEFATPTGKKATIDQESLDDDYWKDAPELKKEAIDFWENNTAFSSPMTLEKAIQQQREYVGLVIPGGQGFICRNFHSFKELFISILF